MLTTVRIEEMWHADREAEPVRFGLPLPEGELSDAGDIGLVLEGRELPVQTRALSHWPDGSVRWALIDFQADLDLRRSLELSVAKGSASRPMPDVKVRVVEEPDAVRIDTGTAQAIVSRSGKPVIEWLASEEGAPCSLALQVEEQSLGALALEVESVRVAASGPLVAEVAVEIAGTADGRRVLDARLLLRFFAGKQHVHVYSTILSRERDLQVSRWRIGVTRSGPVSEIRAHTSMKRARVSEKELLYNYAVDSRSDPIWYEDSPEPCWALWRGASGGVMASVRNPDHHFPTRIAVTQDGIELDLQPNCEQPFHMYPWMGKTMEALVELVPAVSGQGCPDTSVPAESTGYQLTLDAALFQRPVRPVCDPEYYARCRALGAIFPTSRKYYGFEATVSLALRERTIGTGKMHYGDEPNLGYTYSERGHGEMAWTNGEYDTPRMLLMQYARTSNRSWFEAAEAAAFHWMDVDFLRSSPNPRWAGGLCCHEGDHRVEAYAGPSHEWAEGLVDYYHLTGYDEALRTAESIGDNVCRYIEDGEFDRIGTFALRELGWGLTAISGCLRATNKARYRETGLRAVRILRRWADELGGFREVWRYSEPGREDEMLPLAVHRDAFVSLTLNGLNRFYLASGEQEALDLFLEQTEAQLRWFQSPAGWAEQRETKLPNMEAFAYAHRYTKDPAYLEAGLQILDYALTNCTLRFYNLNRTVRDTSHEHPSTYRFMEVSAINSQILGLALIPMFAFLQVAEEAGELESRMR